MKEANELIPIPSINKNQRKRSRYAIDNSELQPLIIDQNQFIKQAASEIGIQVSPAINEIGIQISPTINEIGIQASPTINEIGIQVSPRPNLSGNTYNYHRLEEDCLIIKSNDCKILKL